MVFNRQLLPLSNVLNEEVLFSNFVGIGMNFTAKSAKDPNIEDTVLAASIKGMENNDLRVLSILTTWIGIHSSNLNVDRLTQIVDSQSSERVKAYWSAIAKWQIKDRRFAKMAQIYHGPIIELLGVGTDFQIKRHGEDPRFVSSSLKVSANTLRDRKSDVLSPTQLTFMHSAYRWRTIIGPSYRADMWSELEKNAKLSVAELARLAYGSFATAWKVRKDWCVVHNRTA